MSLQTASDSVVLKRALKQSRRAAWSITVFSAIVNLLMLAGPIYMLQVYDRVLGSRSVPTLVALSICLIGAYALQALLDALRGRIVIRAASLFDRALGADVHAAMVRVATQSRDAGDANQPVRDLEQIRGFLTGAGPVAVVDLPWVPLFLAFCFLIHFWLGILAVVGGVILFSMTWLTERGSQRPAADAAKQAALRAAMIEADRSNAETIVAMGLGDAMASRWTKQSARSLDAAGHASDIVGTYGSVSKAFRILLQSSILGLGAYLVIRQELTAGGMIAASIMVGRALAPIEIAIANWRGFVSARQSYRRLSNLLARTGSARDYTALPAPRRSLDLEGVVVAPPGARVPIVSGVSFGLKAGEALGVVGPSGGGKTSLVRALVRVWPAASGSIRVDGAALDQWSPQVLGRNIGYVSQAVELFDGSIAENIARMAAEPDDEMVVAAARAAGAHEMILRIPGGYDARIGVGGSALSGGQRQRIALARALYGKPFLILLDEPNSNLDSEGELALQQAIRDAKARGAIVILIAHRPAALAVCDKVLYLANGVQQAYGPRDEVLSRILAPQPVRPSVVPMRPEPARDISAGPQR